MKSTPEVSSLSANWHSRAQAVISFAELAAPVREDDISPFSVEGIENPEMELEARVSALLDETEKAITDDPQAAALPLLLGDLEVANALFTASQEPDEVFIEMGSDGGPVTFDAARVNVAILADAATGVVDAPPRPLPAALTDKFDELQRTGGDEIIALVQSPTVQSVTLGGLDGIAAIAGPKVKRAFQVVRGALPWLQKQAVRLTEWVLNRLRSLVPEDFRDKFDELVEQLKEKLGDGIRELVGDVLGRWLGRLAATEAWQSLTPERSAELEPQIDDTLKGHLARIGYVKIARENVDKLSIVTAPLAAANLVPHVRIVLSVAVFGVFGFIVFQIHDGFHDLKALARP